MTIQANRNNVIPKLKGISFVVMVMSGLISAFDAWQIGGFRNPSKSHSLINQRPSFYLLWRSLLFFGVPAFCYNASFFRIINRPLHRIRFPFFRPIWFSLGFSSIPRIELSIHTVSA